MPELSTKRLAEENVSDRKILIIDDEPNNLEIIVEYLNLGENAEFEKITCLNGQEGLEKLHEFKNDIDVILLDRMMPVMSGVEFLEKWQIDQSVNKIPVIMQTASNDRDHMLEGFRLGVYHYLVKPYLPDVLNSVVGAAIEFYQTQRQLSEQVENTRMLFKHVDHATFRIRTLDDVKVMSVSLAQLFPNPQKVVLGISEILTNAIEHGNLGISYEEKTQLVIENKWHDEVTRRLNHPENDKKEVVISFFKRANEVILNVRDQGDGFNFESYLDFDPSRSTHNHGRGIAFANSLSFDEIEYVGNGNEVNCVVKITH